MYHAAFVFMQATRASIIEAARRYNATKDLRDLRITVGRHLWGGGASSLIVNVIDAQSLFWHGKFMGGVDGSVEIVIGAWYYITLSEK